MFGGQLQAMIRVSVQQQLEVIADQAQGPQQALLSARHNPPNQGNGQ